MAELEIPEVKELQEKSHDRESRRIGLLISILAILLAICGAFGKKADNNEIIERVNASNTWAMFQAKKVRAYQAESTSDIMSASKAPQARIQHYQESQQRYETEAKEIAHKAEEYAHEADRWEIRGNRFDLGEIFLQIAVVLCSISILANSRLFVYGGLGFGAVGLIAAVSALLL